MDGKNIPYIAFESEMARYERTIKRLLIALIAAIVLLFASNVAWLWFFNQFDITTEEVVVDGTEQGNANFIGADGVINNGGSEVQEDEVSE